MSEDPHSKPPERAGGGLWRQVAGGVLICLVGYRIFGGDTKPPLLLQPKFEAVGGVVTLQATVRDADSEWVEVRAEGGEPVRLEDNETLHLVIPPDCKRIVVLDSGGNQVIYPLADPPSSAPPTSTTGG